MRITLSLLWLLAVGTGFAMFLKYQNTGGLSGATSAQWPSGARLAQTSECATLVMFAHPRCPCTRASVEELNRLMARVSDRVNAQVWFYQPTNVPLSWSRTSLWFSAVAIPGVTVHEDPDGAQARLFGAETSGTMFLYDARGKLLFKGGITGSRGHAGDNLGEDTIASLCLAHVSDTNQTPVFGCSLFGKGGSLAAGGGGK